MLSAITLFCEDIREEKQGADTLVGVFSDNVSIATPPMPTPVPQGSFVGFSKLAFYTRIVVPLADPTEPIEIKLRDPSGNEFPLGSFNAAFVENARNDAKVRGAQIVGFVAKGIVAPYVVQKAGRLVATVTTPTHELISGNLNIEIGMAQATVATASQPPSSQSPSVPSSSGS